MTLKQRILNLNPSGIKSDELITIKETRMYCMAKKDCLAEFESWLTEKIAEMEKMKIATDNSNPLIGLSSILVNDYISKCQQKLKEG